MSLEKYYKYGKDAKFRIEKLSQSNFKYINNFSCGNNEIDSYLIKKAIDDDEGTTYLVIDELYSEVIGYCTMCCSGLTSKYQNSIRTLPAIEIKYFALSENVQKILYDEDDDHYYFSDYIFHTFIGMCENIAQTVIAAKYIILYSVPSAIYFYKRIGFTNFSKFHEPDNYLYINGCTPMYAEIEI